jgi:hypothetical protein
VAVLFSDNRELPGTLVGGDQESDVAVVTVARTDMAPLTFAGPPFETVRRESSIAPAEGSGVAVGAEVVAIGFPLDLDRQPTVSKGIISAVDRNLGDASEFIQIDATIDHGSSGGPLFNVSGEVIGINSRAFQKDLNFAIPYTIAKAVIGDLVLTGRVTRGLLPIKGLSLLNRQADTLTHSGYPFEEGYLVTYSSYQPVRRRQNVPSGLLRTCDLIQSIDWARPTDAASGGCQSCKVLAKSPIKFLIRSEGDLNNALLWIPPKANVAINVLRYPEEKCEMALDKTDISQPLFWLDTLRGVTGKPERVELTIE